MTRFIGLGHYSRTGKTSFSNYLEQALRDIDPKIKVKSIPLAAKLKDVTHQLYGWAGLQDMAFYETSEGAKARNIVLPKLGLSPVDIWIKFGTPAVRENVYDGTWVDYVLKADHDADIVIVPDIRFPNEVQAFGAAGASFFKIVRPGFGPREGSVADAALLGWDGWDYVFGGSGQMSELNYRAQEVAEWLTGHRHSVVQTPVERQAALAVEVLPKKESTWDWLKKKVNILK